MATREQIGDALKRAHEAGDTDAAVKLAKAYRDFDAQIQSPGMTKPASNPYEDKSHFSNFLLGTGNAVIDQARGVGQLLRDAMPSDVADKIGLPTVQDVEMARRKNAPLLETTAGKAGDFFGSFAPALALPGGTLAKAALSGGALGAIQPRGEGDSLAKNIGAGMAGGAIGQGAVAASGRLLRPVRTELSPALQNLAQKAEQYGIGLTPAQRTGSKPLKWMESVMDDLPLTAARQAKLNELQHTQFNRALAGTMGTPATTLDEAVMALTKKRVGEGIGDIAARNKLTFDYDLLRDLTQHKFDAMRFETDGVDRVVTNYIDDFMSKVEPNGTVSGDAYRKLDSELGRRMRGTSNGDLKHALGGLRDTLRGAMDKSISPSDAAEWATLRKQYANMKKLEPLAAKSTDGNISPAAVRAASIKGDPNAAYRTNDLKDLGKIGQEFLKPPPSSGTAQRQFYTKLLTSPVNLGNLLGGAGGYVAGGAPGAALGGLLSTALTSGLAAVPLQTLMMSKVGKKYLSEGILNSLQGYEPIAGKLSGPIGAAGLLQLLNASSQ